MASIRFEQAERWYPGSDTPAVAGIDLEVRDGEFMVLVGPSGCGKSTTLRMLAGLEPVDRGSIHLGDREITGVPPKDRDIAMVFQNYALYPHMSVADNMAFALKMRKMPVEERSSRVAEAAKLLGLTDYLHRKPNALSGGQRQRVAMGRAIVRQPEVFCMDEPLSNLDAKMRVQTRTDIARLQSDLGFTTVYVTHDQVEAMTMGDRVAVMEGGYIRQVDAPLDLYSRPANLFVASFIGSPQMNLVQVPVEAGRVRVGGWTVPVPAASLGTASSVTVGVRPESWRVVDPAETDSLEVRVGVIEELGSDAYVYGRARTGDGDQDVVVRVGSQERWSKDDVLHVVADARAIHLFDSASGERLAD